MDGQQPRVWWVNQGTTYGEARRAGVLWAPLVNKVGRPQGHWETMDRVEAGDIILHYSHGALRATSTAEGPSSRAKNPFGTDEWNSDGRLIRATYQDLREPIPLASIASNIRTPAAGPFTNVGSVQQGYLYAMDQQATRMLVRDFPQLREALSTYEPATEPAADLSVDLAQLHRNFATAVAASGLTFSRSNSLVRSFLSSILAKPFTILTGLSGSGKTQLAMRLGDWFGHDSDGRSRHLVVAVRPDWTGPEALLGYEDALRSTEASRPVWYAPDALQFILRARNDPTAPYLLILDEMNLAHVERYFADFLSGMESRQPILPDLVQPDSDSSWEVRSISGERLELPRNLFVVGTVNVDETTYMFSPKVLDRAWTHEFRVTADDLDPTRGRPVPAPSADERVVQLVCSLVEDDSWHRDHPYAKQEELVEELREVHKLLAKVNLEFGHRTMYESVRFAAVYAATGDLEAGSSADPAVDEILDLILMKKILPRLHGSRRLLEPTLIELATRAGGTNDLERWPLTHAKVQRMLDTLRANQFVSFAE